MSSSERSIRRVAANTVVLPNGMSYKNHVVELFGGRLVNHYPLQGEIAMTEWLGGRIEIEKEGRKAFHIITLADGTLHRQQL